MNLPAGVNNALTNLKMGAKNYAPEILTVVGIGFMVGAAIVACKRTPKAQRVLAQAEEDRNSAELAKQKALDDENFAKEYTEDDYKSDRRIIAIHTIKGIAGAYGPAIALGICGIACILGGNHLMRVRYTAVAAAYSSLSKAYDEYRKRVREKVGEKEEQDLFDGVKSKIIMAEEIDPETGEVKEVPKEVKEYTGGNLYTFIFDETNRNWDKDMFQNIRFLEGQQLWADNLLKRKGYLFLSQVLESLGFEPTRESFEIGWKYDLNDQTGDNYVSFGPHLGSLIEEPVGDILHMGRDGIRLQFNPNGCITYMFPTKMHIAPKKKGMIDVGATEVA